MGVIFAQGDALDEFFPPEVTYLCMMSLIRVIKIKDESFLKCYLSQRFLLLQWDVIYEEELP